MLSPRSSASCLCNAFPMTSLCLFGAVGRPHLYSCKGSFYIYIIGTSFLLNFSPGEWSSLYKRNPQKSHQQAIFEDFFWSGLRGSNSLPPPWQGGALPDELNPRKWCLRSESNQRHADFQSAALPTELQRHINSAFGRLAIQIGDPDGARTHDL